MAGFEPGCALVWDSDCSADCDKASVTRCYFKKLAQFSLNLP